MLIKFRSSPACGPYRQAQLGPCFVLCPCPSARVPIMGPWRVSPSLLVRLIHVIGNVVCLRLCFPPLSRLKKCDLCRISTCKPSFWGCSGSGGVKSGCVSSCWLSFRCPTLQLRSHLSSRPHSSSSLVVFGALALAEGMGDRGSLFLIIVLSSFLLSSWLCRPAHPAAICVHPNVFLLCTRSLSTCKIRMTVGAGLKTALNCNNFPVRVPGCRSHAVSPGPPPMGQLASNKSFEKTEKKRNYHGEIGLATRPCHKPRASISPIAAPNTDEPPKLRTPQPAHQSIIGERGHRFAYNEESV